LNPTPEPEPTTDAVSIRVVFFGPPKSGKTLTVRRLHALLAASGQAGKLISINAFDGSTLLLDYFLIDMGLVDDQEVFLQIYAAPGNPLYHLAARRAFNAADVAVFVTDCRDGFLPHTLGALNELRENLKTQPQPFDSFPLIIQLNKVDVLGCRPSNSLTFNKLDALGKPLFFTSALRDEGLGPMFKKTIELGLNRIDSSTKAPRPLSALPPPLEVDESVAREIAAANEIYLRTFSSITTAYSPHSESFLGAILEKFGLVSQAQLRRAMDLQHRAFDEDRDETLDSVLVNEKMVDQHEVDQAIRLKGISEIIHEELLYGKIAVENDYVPFSRVKTCILHQKRHHFAVGLGELLMDTGEITMRQHAAVLEELAVIHRTESERHTRMIGGRKTSAFVKPMELKDGKRPEGHFGSLAVKNKFITQRQLDECLVIQQNLKDKGSEKYLGVILQERGFLTNREVEVLCSTLEAELAKNPIEGFKIEAQLGRGNMGLVYAAKQIKLDRIVALKVLDPKLAMDAEFIQRFYKEARVGAQVNHTNMVQFYDVGESGGYHYISMEYVEGLTVKDIIERDKTMDESWALDIAKQVVRALHHAMSVSLIHLDIKPGNIMINDKGETKICDLGLAKQMDKPGVDFSPGMIVGSPFYISPEQIERVEDLDERADIYGLGATLYHMLTGRPPFTGRNAEDIFLKHLTHRVPPLLDANPGLRPELELLIKKMLAKDRADRFQNHADLLKELQRLTGEATGIPSRTGLGSFARKLSTIIRRRPEES
jgi:serine/threonine-protein kinase